MTATKNVERQVAVATVIAVEEPPFLFPVHRVVGGVEIEDDLLWRSLVRLQEQRHQQPRDSRRVVGDLVIARRLVPAQFEPIERRLAGHRRAVLARCRQLPGQHRHDRIVAQLVMVVEVLVAERDPVDPLPDQRRNRCSTSSGSRRSMKHSAKRPTKPIARSVAPNSNAPASDVIAPPSNPATTIRPSTGANPKVLGYTLSASGRSANHSNCCCTTTFADSPPRCT